MDRVKFAARRAQAAADAAVEVYDGGAASKAPGSFRLDLLFREGQAQVRESADRIAGLSAGHLSLCGVKRFNDNIVFVQLDELVLVAGDGLGLSGMHVAVHALAGLLAVRDRVDGKARAVRDVAAHKDAGLAGLEGQRIVLDRAVQVTLHICPFEKLSPLGGLADGLKDIRALDGDRAVVHKLGLKDMNLIKDGDALSEDDTRHLAVFCQDLLGTPAVHDRDAFRDGLFHFVARRGHLALTLETEHGDFAVRDAGRHAGHIHGHVSAADDDDVALQTDRVILIGPRQEADAELDAFRVLTGHAGPAATLQADGQIEGLIALSLEVLDRDVFSDFHAAFELDAHLAKHVDLRLDDVLFQTEGRNSVHQHTAGTALLLKYGDVVAAGPQIIGRRHAGRASTDDRHLVVGSPHAAVVLLADRDEALVGVQFLVGDEFFDLVDGDGIVHRASRAGVLAAPVADRAADRREGVVLLDEL